MLHAQPLDHRQSSRAKFLSVGTPLRQYTQIYAGVVKSLAVCKDAVYQVEAVHAKIGCIG
jgi:hypothetical protein